MQKNEFKPIEYEIGKVLFYNSSGKKFKVVERKIEICGRICTSSGCMTPECDLCGDPFVCISSKCNASERSDGKNICYKEIK